SQAFNPQDGSFELRDVTPGMHVIRSQVSISSTAVTPATGGVVSTIAQNGSIQVALNVTSDTNSLSLVLGSPATINGQLTMEGSTAPSAMGLDRVQVQLRASVEGVVYSNLGGITPLTRPTSADGMFRIDSVVPGEYRLTVSPLPES